MDETCTLDEALFVLVSEGVYDEKTDSVKYKLVIHTNAVGTNENAKTMIKEAT